MRGTPLPIFLALALISSSALAGLPADSEIRKILADRVGREDSGAGIVVGAIDAKGPRVISHGRGLDGNTVFEIGSLTKVFTAVLLMDMVRRGEVALTDPVSKYLPAGVRLPERKGRKITLADLATHTSGLPSFPSNIHPKDEGNPYADYSVQQMYDFLSGYQLQRDIGSQYEYSNLGFGLLGHVLSRRAGKSYEALVRSRICDPLGMTSTSITLTPDRKKRLAAGHDATLAPVPNWDIPTLAGTGALRSTANDLLRFLAASLGYVKTPLARAMADAVSVRRPAGAAGSEVAYGWHVQSKEGRSIIWQNGGTGGYASYLAYDPQARTGVVVLTNVGSETGPDDIGRHLLDESHPLAKVERRPPVEHRQVALDPKLFDRYVGTYRLEQYVLLAASRDGDRFYVQLTGYPKIEIFPESERDFFVKNTAMQLSFDATRVTVHEPGLDRVASRLTGSEIERALADIDAHHAEIARRFKEQTRFPGSEDALRRSIRELQAGAPDYEKMNPLLALIIRRQLPQWKAAIDSYGALRSVRFKGVEPTGADIYQVDFEHAKTEWRISMGGDGKTDAVVFHPL